MKKRCLTVLLAMIVCLPCVFCFTACVSVDTEDWFEMITGDRDDESDNKNDNTDAPSDDTSTIPIVGTNVGYICPNITLDVLGSDTDFELSANRGKIVVLNFWYTTCGPCVEELPHFNEASVTYADDVVIVPIHIEFPGMVSADVTAWIDEVYPEWNEGNLLFAWDAGKTVQNLFGVQACPTTVVIDGNGVIADIFDGLMTNDELIAAIEDAKAN